MDADGDAFAHGVVIDGEPDPHIWDNSSLDNSDDSAGYWVIVKLTSVSNNDINLPKDACFSHDGHDLNKQDLKPKALAEATEGILIWHEYLHPRMLASKSAKKARTAPCKGLVKGSNKRKSYR